MFGLTVVLVPTGGFGLKAGKQDRICLLAGDNLALALPRSAAGQRSRPYVGFCERNTGFGCES